MKSSSLNGRTIWVLAGFIVIALFFLLSEHRAHFLGALPWLLLLACPLFHLLHGGHGHGGHNGDAEHGETRPDLRQRGKS